MTTLTKWNVMKPALVIAIASAFAQASRADSITFEIASREQFTRATRSPWMCLQTPFSMRNHRL
jgi:hypothetical protein